MFKIIVLQILAFICVNSMPQQQQQQNFQDVIASIFNSTTAAPVRRVGGFGNIVVPEPEGPTIEPQVFIRDEQRCVCVPYHMCDPRTNRVNTPTPANKNNDNNNNNENDQIDGFGLIDIRFSAESCQDVLDVCCIDDSRTTEPISLPPLNDREPERPTGCGLRNPNGIDFQITGNKNNEANFGEFPWTLAILLSSNDSCLCGASLIHPQVVLTANHCVRKYASNPGQLKVRAGEWDTQTTKERLPYQERAVSRIISHPQYEIRTLANDVALLIMQSPFKLDDHISVVCLPPASHVPNNPNCIATGWGKDVFGKQGKYSVIQKRIPLPIVPFDRCQNDLRKTRLGNAFQLSTTFICAGGVEGVDTCEGDGGAPLVCPVGNPTQNRYAQNGIVAWGIGCNEARPAVYANVALARQWIDTQMTSLGYGTSTYTY